MGDRQTTNASSVELRTERLLLRRPVMDDVERLAEVANDRRVARNMTPAFPHPYTVEDAIKFVESKPNGFAIVPLEPPDEIGPGVVGMVGGEPIDHSPGVYISVTGWASTPGVAATQPKRQALSWNTWWPTSRLGGWRPGCSHGTRPLDGSWRSSGSSSRPE